MAKKMTREQLDIIVSNFARQSTRKNDYAFTVGYLQSLTIQLLGQLSAKEQQHHIDVLLSSSVWNMESK